MWTLYIFLAGGKCGAARRGPQARQQVLNISFIPTPKCFRMFSVFSAAVLIPTRGFCHWRRPEPDQNLRERSFSEDPFGKAANLAPAAFVEHVLPEILKISDLAVRPDTSPPRLDAVWWIPIKDSHFEPSGV